MSDVFNLGLLDLGDVPDKGKIEALGMIAEDALGDSACVQSLCATLYSRLNACPPSGKIPLLYTLDHITKKLGSEFSDAFSPALTDNFAAAYATLSEQDQGRLKRLLQTWNDNGFYAAQLRGIYARILSMPPGAMAGYGGGANPLELGGVRKRVRTDDGAVGPGPKLAYASTALSGMPPGKNGGGVLGGGSLLGGILASLKPSGAAGLGSLANPVSQLPNLNRENALSASTLSIPSDAPRWALYSQRPYICGLSGIRFSVRDEQLAYTAKLKQLATAAQGPRCASWYLSLDAWPSVAAGECGGTYGSNFFELEARKRAEAEGSKPAASLTCSSDEQNSVPVKDVTTTTGEPPTCTICKEPFTKAFQDKLDAFVYVGVKLVESGDLAHVLCAGP